MQLKFGIQEIPSPHFSEAPLHGFRRFRLIPIDASSAAADGNETTLLVGAEERSAGWQMGASSSSIDWTEWRSILCRGGPLFLYRVTLSIAHLGSVKCINESCYFSLLLAWAERQL